MLLSYARQIAFGIAYMGFKSFVHRDIAARNILISADGTMCKVSVLIFLCSLLPIDI